MAVLDSLQLTADNVQTQLPCSPRSLFHSNISQKTLQEMATAEAEQLLEGAVGSQVGLGKAQSRYVHIIYIPLSGCVVYICI